MQTKLLYLEHMHQYECEALVVEVLVEEGKTVVILDQTVFYPQGGGQPYDTGSISCRERTFFVEEVRFVEGVVRHIGRFEGEVFTAGEMVVCSVDVPRRQLNTRLHSAGHLVDMGLKQLDISWEPGKGYHFPNGPYVEYTGSLDGLDKEKIKSDLEDACNQVIQKGMETKVLLTNPTRVVMYGGFGIPCGGTHVNNLSEIGRFTIRKIKKEGENIRFSYNII